MAFHDNEKYGEFVKQLGAKGVTVRCMWQARRDGKPINQKRPADVEMISFTGNGFQPSVLVAIVIDYGKRDGFGLFTDSPGLSISADVDSIATPNKHAA